MNRDRLALLALVGVLSLCLASCGGGGGSNGGRNGGVTPPSAPEVSLAPSVKQLQFSWTGGSSATEFHLLEDPDGQSGLAQVGTTIAAPATVGTLDIAVHRMNWVKAQFAVDACNAGGCTRSNQTSALALMLPTIGYFKASNTGPQQLFGHAVALSGDGETLAVGAPLESSSATGINGDEQNTAATFAGAVYIFARSSGTWSQQAYVKASNTGINQYFGWSVSLSADGNTLAVGAYQESSIATGINGNQNDTSAPKAGAVYVFSRSSGTWSQQAYVKASNTDANDYFGRSVALSADGNTLAVGAYGECSSATGINGNQGDNSACNSGAAYVFTRNAGIWSQQAYVKASNTGAGDYFGSSVALSADGNTLAVGAYGEASAATGINGNESDNSLQFAGAAYVFVRSGSTWMQEAYVKSSNAGAGDYFGDSLALSADGNTLAVGAVFESSAATGVNGDQNSDAASQSGAAYVFTRSSNAWSQQAYIKASNTDAQDGFGYSVALSSDGNLLSVGAAGEASIATGINGNQSDNSSPFSGAEYTFLRDGAASWAQQAYIKASNTQGGAYFGLASALSADGNTLAVGARFERGDAKGIDGNPSDNAIPAAGAVYLY